MRNVKKKMAELFARRNVYRNCPRDNEKPSTP